MLSTKRRRSLYTYRYICTNICIFVLFLLFAATYPESKLVHIWSSFSPGHAPILLPSTVQTSLLEESHWDSAGEGTGTINSQQFPSLESEPLDMRVSKRLFFYGYFIYMASACVAPQPMLLLNTGTHSGAGGRGQVCG